LPPHFSVAPTIPGIVSFQITEKRLRSPNMREFVEVQWIGNLAENRGESGISENRENPFSNLD
jgi:hypothetical protein